MQLRLARYRARAHVCNACPGKGDCTDSDTGRELTRALDPWPHSEVGRFHRGIAVAIVGFGILVIGAGAVLHHDPADLAVLGGTLLVSTVVGLYLLADFRAAPSGFPWTEGERSGPAPVPAQAERSASSILSEDLEALGREPLLDHREEDALLMADVIVEQLAERIQLLSLG